MNDISSSSSENFWRFRPLAELIVALRLLSRLPLPFLRTLNLPSLSLAMRLFPVAGILIGTLVAGVLIAARWLGLPPLLAAAVSLGFGTIITGALHEDGLADTADGLGGGVTREQRLEIMRDSRIGAYGAIALVLAYMARASIYEVIGGMKPLGVLLLLTAAAAFSRSLMVDLLWATGPARREGLSYYAGRPSKATALCALILGGGYALLAIGYVAGPIVALLALAGAALMQGLVRYLAIRMIGGQTGDICGASQVLTEIAMLSVVVATIH